MSAYRDLIPIEKCARCGYCEMNGSLHVHHLDRDRTNNDPSNLIVFCANCHYGLHHHIWKLEDIGLTTPKNNKKEIEKRQTGDDLRRSISWLQEKKSNLERELNTLQANVFEYNRLKNQVLLDSKKQATILHILPKVNLDALDVVLYILYGAKESDLMLLGNEFDNSIIDRIMSSYSHNFGFMLLSYKKMKEYKEKQERSAFDSMGFRLR